MVQRVAQLFGVVFLLIGILGFVTGGVSMDTTMLLGLFPVNVLHNVVHCLFGVWGLAAGRSFAGALQFAKIGGAIYVLLAVLGLLVPDTFGLIPIGGHDVWLHAIIGIVLVGTAMSAVKSGSTATTA